VEVWLFCLVLWLAAFGAGFLGSLTGLGGGVVIVPLLVVLGIDIRYAIGASLVSVIATSSGAASAYVREGYSNLRAGLLLEIATTLGALSGAYLAASFLGESVEGRSVIAVVFGLVLLLSAYLSRHQAEPSPTDKPDRLATWLKLDGDYPTPQGRQSYRVRNVPAGFGLMYVAGVLSGLLGIGSGAVKVLAMDQAMRMPFKVSTTTSNFMIGVTAAASAGVFLHAGYIDPGLAMPVVLGVLPGALLGTVVLARARVRSLRLVFALVIVALGLQMIYKGFTGEL
jgi:uncharacterized membrane protein YfcA